MQSDILKKLKAIPSKTDMLLDSVETAAAIIAAREALNISQKSLAIEMEISQVQLSDLERGTSRRWSLKLFENAQAALERLVNERQKLKKR